MKNFKSITMWMVATILATVACRKEMPATNDAKNGSFSVRMTDGPGNYAALNVEITKVEAYLQNEGWITLDNQAKTIDVISLNNGIETQLAYQTNAAAGVYTKLRLTFGNTNKLSVNADATTGGTSGSATVDLVWNGPKEVEIQINEEISANAKADVLLDFNVVASIVHYTCDYILKPAIKEIKDAATGIQGQVEGSAHAAVMIMQNGDTVLATYTDTYGKFLIRGADAGTYDLLVVPEPAFPEVGILKDKTISGMVITKGEITQAGTIKL